MPNILLMIWCALFFVSVLNVGKQFTRWFKLTSDTFIERIIFAFTFGSIFYSYVFHILGAFQMLYEPILLLLYFAPLGLSFFLIYEKWNGKKIRLPKRIISFTEVWQYFCQPHVGIPLLLLGFVFFPLIPFLFTYPNGWDVLAYHLPLPKVYLAYHSLPFKAWFAQTGFPIGIEALFGYGEAFHEPRVANFINFSYVLATTAYLLVGLRSIFSQKVRWVATFFYVAQPMLYTEVAISAYVDYPFSFFMLVATVLLMRFAQDKKPRTFLSACVIIGFIALIKTSGLIVIASFFVLLASLVWQERFAAQSIAYFKKMTLPLWALCAANSIPISAWLLRNTLATRNPFYPFYNNLFHGLGYTPGTLQVLDDIWSTSFVVKMIQNFWHSNDSPQDYLNLAALLFMILGAIACFILLRHKRRELRILARFTLVALILLIISIGPITRYVFFVFPALGLAIGTIIFEKPSSKRKQFRWLQPILYWSFVSCVIFTLFVQLDGMFYTRQKLFLGLPKRQWLYMMDARTDHAMLYQQDNYAAQEYANTHLNPHQDKVLQLLDNRVYYLDIPAEFANTIEGGYFTNPPDRNAGDVYQRIKADGFTHVLKLDAWGAHPSMRQDLFNSFMDSYVTPVATASGVTLYKLK